MQNEALRTAEIADSSQNVENRIAKCASVVTYWLKIRSLLFAFISGACLPFAFAPFDIWFLAIISPAILLWLWQDPKILPKHASLLGFSYGLGFFGFGVSWVFVSIHRFGGSNIPVSVFITLLFVIILSLFLALQGFILKRFFKGSMPLFALIGFPSAWVLLEWFRSVFLTGFPWLFLGYSQLQTSLSGFAPVGSVYLVSLMVLILAASLTLFFKTHLKVKILAMIIIIFTWGLGTILSQFTWTKPLGHELTVSLVQANIPPLAKFGQKDAILAIKQSYGKLSDSLWGRDLILWPESAIALPLPYSIPYIKELNKQALDHGSTLIAGTQVLLSEREIYNSVVAVGVGQGMYHKQHLVPFGDFLPFEDILRGIISFFDLPMSSFNSGAAGQDLITAGAIKISPEICYEIAFPELVRASLRDGNAIVTLSEDGWFGDSFGPHQHLQIARMRALELGRPVLRATTSGITAIIDHQGHVAAKLPQFQASVLNGNVQPMQGKTPWQRIGIWPLLILLLLVFLVPGRIITRKIKRKKDDRE